MMDEDSHLDTGTYDSKKYWEERARTSNGNRYQAVCVFRYLDCLNEAAEQIQEHYLGHLLRASGLKSGRALEFGCGVGRWVDLVTGTGLKFVGSDISENMISFARASNPDSEFEVIDGIHLPFPDESFDLVYSVTVLHHNPFERQEEILSEINRVLRPGGYLILLEDISRNEREKTGFNMFIRSPEGWTNTVCGNGDFQLIETRFLRWWIFTRSAARLLGGLYRIVTGKKLAIESQSGTYGRMVAALVRTLAKLDLSMQPILPVRYCVNAAMLLRKKSSD